MKGKTARKLLPEKYRNLFENKMIVCIEYEGLSDDQEREMFQVSFVSQYLFSGFLTHFSESTNGDGADTRGYDCFHLSRVDLTFVVFRTPPSYQRAFPRYNPGGPQAYGRQRTVRKSLQD